jgi:hypothetical protein
MLRISTALILLFLFGTISRSATAQWLHYPSPGIPRAPDGKPDLACNSPMRLQWRDPERMTRHP